MVMLKTGIYVLVSFSTLLAIASCQRPEELQEIKEYEGPLREAENMELFYTEQTIVKTRVKAARIWEYESGDREFPEGIYLEFYNEVGDTTTTLRANTAYYTKADNLWRGRGNVVVKNLEDGQQLSTEELFWDPDKQTIFTDKFVTVREGDQVLYGTGLEAKQDFSSWYIKDVEGEFYLEDDEAQ